MSIQSNQSCIYAIECDFNSLMQKERKKVVFDCEKCSYTSCNSKKNDLNLECLRNIIKVFKENSDITDGFFKTGEEEFKFTNIQVDLYRDYARLLNKIHQKRQKLSFKIKKECLKNLECESKQEFFIEQIFGSKFNEGSLITNPIEAYLQFKQEFKIKMELLSENPKCHKCFESYLNFLNEVRTILEESKIIKNYLELDLKSSSFSKIYSLIFGDYNLVSSFPQKGFRYPNILEECTSYHRSPYKIKIKKNKDSNRYFYEITSIIDDPDLRLIYNRILKEVDTNFKDFIGIEGIIKLDRLLQFLKTFAMQVIEKQYGQLPTDLIPKLAELISFELSQLHPIMALLIDDEIEEIFMDSLNGSIYLDHRQFGRCQTSIVLNNTKIESLKTRIRIEAEQRLDETHPFLKTEIITSYFHVRVSLEISSLAVDKFIMRIRKLHKKILTIGDLIANNTITQEAAAYLLFNWLHGRCILVIGEPYSGKTTLINSLDMLGKKDWRKIYVEDVIESIDQGAFEIHQSRYNVKSGETQSDPYSTKSFQVKECLHRTPDSIFIGELIHSDAIEAFFFLLKVGLRRCLATAHGESPEMIVKRFVFDNHIPVTLLGNLDIVVQLDKIAFRGQFLRRITRITEISENSEVKFGKVKNSRDISSLSYEDIFTRDPETDELKGLFGSLDELYKKSISIRNINSLRGENVSEDQFIYEMNKIQSTLEKSSPEMGEIIKNFHQLWDDFELNTEGIKYFLKK